MVQLMPLLAQNQSLALFKARLSRGFIFLVPGCHRRSHEMGVVVVVCFHVVT